MNFGITVLYNFPNMRGGINGRWNFSENSSVLKTPLVPFCQPDSSKTVIECSLFLLNEMMSCMQFSIRSDWRFSRVNAYSI